MFQLFRNPNFARLFFGNLITNAGNNLYAVAAIWLVYQLGGSTLYTGLAGFLTTLPAVLRFLIGPLVDRWPLRNTLVGAEVVQGALVLVIPITALIGQLNIAVVLIVLPLAALAGRFSYPATTAALPRVVSPEELVRANSALAHRSQVKPLAALSSSNSRPVAA